MATIAEALTLGLKHHQAGQLRQAEQFYRQILQADPRHADALHLLGVLVSQAGRDDLAISYIEQALAVKPHVAAFHNNLGFSYQALGRLDEAAAHYREALRLQPDYAMAHNNLGNVYWSRGQGEQASLCYRQALRYQPDYPEAHNNLGVTFQEGRQMEAAVPCFREALRLNPNFIEGYNNLGVALQSLGKLDEAVASFLQALGRRPDDAEAHSNLGNALKEQGKLEEAVAHYRRAVRLKPTYAVGHNNLGFALQEQGHYDEAMACYDEALRINPQSSEAHWNRSLLRLLLGDFEQGWAEYEWRWTQPSFTRRNFRQPLWDGRPLGDRTILLHIEQGFGDMIQFIRYVPLVKERGGHIVVECHPPLVRLLSGIQGIDRVVALGSALPSFDVQAPLVSLPGIFHTSVGTIPRNVPYLSADPDLLEKWRRELEPLGARKIGIAWQGNPTYRADRQRSIPLARFAPLAKVQGVNLVSLQKGPATDQIHALAVQFPVLDLSGRLDEASGAFMDTAAVMKNLDLVITSDTAVAHLAGALAVPVWVALAFVPDWRWLLEREDCPWYPTMQLFRQKAPGEWEEVFEHMAANILVCLPPSGSL